jgi:mono/diheme cytochrome c family protein
MPRSIWPKALLAFVVAPAALSAGALVQTEAPKRAAADAQQFFTNEVQPILKQSCLLCHSGEKPAGGFSLTSRAAALKGGLLGPAVNLGKPEHSLLIKAINYHGPQMPPAGKLPQKQIDILTQWVKSGLAWSDAKVEAPIPHGPPKVTPEAMKFWSFRPVKRPAVPSVKQKAWVRNPIDAFVLKQLEASNLKPNSQASKTALIRRAYYDLIGLPPSPEEMKSFLADVAPDAYDKLVDRLLASPQYGEKWGRHWLDLVRFAETNSYERDGPKPFAWRYRDYVIKSFNDDKPYDRFITEQLAGDELKPRTPEGLIATGYYRLGLWDDEPADPKQALYDDLDDISSTTGQVMLGLTVNCARCHDHKIDPVPQKDYYRFLAFFSGIKRFGVRSSESIEEASLRSIAPPEEQQKQNEAIAAHQALVKKNQDEVGVIEQRILADLTPVEKEEWQDQVKRPGIVKKRVGTILAQADYDRYLDLREERRRLFRTQPRALDMALCVTEVGATPRPMHVLMRGNPHVEGEKVEPGFPSVLNPPAAELGPSPHGDTSGRRLALAKWMVSPQNPLTARVMVNRVWKYHFGRGIVRTPSDFGFQGSKPTHPELLDWLASEFVAGGWKLKPLHKQIMLSSTYRMSSAQNAKAYAADPDNDLLWRFDMRRLLAEEVRDSILAVNGTLNLKMGGPSIYTTIPAEVLAGQSMPGAGWGKSSPEEEARRSVYIYVKRSLITPIIASFDGPETDFSCPVRFATTQPTQALGMINSAFVNKEARLFAAALRKQAGEDTAAQVRLCLWRVMQREPTKAEIDRGLRLISSLESKHNAKPADALALYCVVALNLNEFLYLD